MSAHAPATVAAPVNRNLRRVNILRLRGDSTLGRCVNAQVCVQVQANWMWGGPRPLTDCCAKPKTRLQSHDCEPGYEDADISCATAVTTARGSIGFATCI